MHQIVSSYGDHAISMTMQDSVIKFKQLPALRPFTDYFFVILDQNGNEEYKTLPQSVPPTSFIIPQYIKNGLHYFSIATKSPYKNDVYIYYLNIKDIPFEKHGDFTYFVYSDVHDDNYAFINRLTEEIQNRGAIYDQSIKATRMIQSTNKLIQELALDLTKESKDIMSKVKSIHFWVSRHLFYDSDAANNKNGGSVYKEQSALDALNNDKCVCQGFANLMVAMCRSLDIPSLCLGVYTLPLKEQWSENDNMKHRATHQIPIIWNGNRWMICDPTWDNDQFIDNLVYGERLGTGIPYKYFDNTIGFISHTHHLMEVVNI